MRKQMGSLTIYFIFCVLATSFVGCTTQRSMETQSPNGGNVQSYEVPYKTAFDLALYACKVLDVSIESQNYEQKYIVASNGISGWSWGERIGIYFIEVEKNRTEIRVVSKAKVKTNVFAPKWSQEIHQIIRDRISQLDKYKTKI